MVWGVFFGLWGYLEGLWGFFGASWGPGAPEKEKRQKCLRFLGGSWEVLGGSWRPLGFSWRPRSCRNPKKIDAKND